MFRIYLNYQLAALVILGVGLLAEPLNRYGPNQALIVIFLTAVLVGGGCLMCDYFKVVAACGLPFLAVFFLWLATSNMPVWIPSKMWWLTGYMAVTVIVVFVAKEIHELGNNRYGPPERLVRD